MQSSFQFLNTDIHKIVVQVVWGSIEKQFGAKDGAPGEKKKSVGRE